MQDLINKDRNTELLLPQNKTLLFPEQKVIEDSIKNYKNVSIKNYINESYFLNNKSDLIKETFITALNIKISIYGSISYFNKKKKLKYLK